MIRSKKTIDALRLAGDLGSIPLTTVAAALSWRWLENNAPSSDGRGVLLIPGYKTSEISLFPARAFLNRKKFRAATWGLGTNHGAADTESMQELIARIEKRAELIAAITGRPIAIAGHSLGGILARAVANLRPDIIDRVVTIGSPYFTGPAQASSVNSFLAKTLEKSGGRSLEHQIGDAARLGFWNAPPCPLISIQSPYDGFLGADILAQPEAGTGRHWYERIDTLSTHCGMCLNPFTLLALADRLSVKGDNWTPFDPSSYGNRLIQRGYLSQSPRQNEIAKHETAAISAHDSYER